MPVMNLLVAFNGSDASVAALRYAATEASEPLKATSKFITGMSAALPNARGDKDTAIRQLARRPQQTSRVQREAVGRVVIHQHVNRARGMFEHNVGGALNGAFQQAIGHTAKRERAGR